jgi:hypothetical protein
VILALSLYGIPVEPALAFAVVAHALQMGSALILAAVAAICQGISIKSLAAAWEAKF